MSQLFAASPPISYRRALARAWDDPDSRSIMVGLVGVILYFLLVLFMWLKDPHIFSSDISVVRPQASARQFNIEIAPDTFVKPPPKPPPFHFVETNPDAPENTPDNTNNVGAQNQQAAQEKPKPDAHSDRPATEGKKDFDTTQIVSGQLVKPVQEQEAIPDQPTTPREATTAVPRAEQNPLSGFDKKQGEDSTSYGSNIARFPNNPRPIPEKIDGAKDVPLVEGATATQPAIDPQHPRPRPMVTRLPQTRPAILAEQVASAPNVGPTAYDAKWSNYAGYLQKMIDIVQIQWERILLESKVYPPSGSTVAVKFVINSQGEIARIISVDNHSTESAARACISGIKDRSPYGPWTDDMKAMLGEEQEMTFTFYYQ